MTRRFEQTKESVLALDAIAEEASSLTNMVSGKGTSNTVRATAGLSAGAVLLGVATIMAVAWMSGLLLLGFFASFFLITTCAVFFVVLQSLRPQKTKRLDRDLLLSAIDSRPEAVAITDSEGVLICANPAYGRLFNGFPSPGKLDFYGAENPIHMARNQGFAEAELAGQEGQIRARVEKSRYGKGYLVWEMQIGRETNAVPSVSSATIKSCADWLDGRGVGFAVTDHDGIVVFASHQMTEWAGDPLVGERLDTVLSIDPTKGQGQFLSNTHKQKLTCSIQPVDSENADGVTVYFLEDQDATQANTVLDVGDLPQQVFDDAPVGIAIVDENGLLLRCNGPTKQILGCSDCDGSLRLMDLVVAEHQDAISRMQKKAIDGEAERKPLEVHFSHNPENVTQIFARSLKGGGGAVFYLIDTTEQKQLELQFTQAQKMQAVGQLAGGIAHDFNNILTAMIGFCDLLLVRHGAGDASFSDIMQIKQNANRAANLVRQLLAFSRQQTLRPSVLIVTDVLAELSNLLRRLIGENIELKMVHGRDLGAIKVDQGQLEQVIINLAVNARDAMPGGGQLTISTHMVSPKDVVKMGHSFMPAQDYVAMVIQDTGHGIPKGLLPKIFEPFFTTKEVGKGTGLGLSTVYGIVKQTGGFIFADSEEGKGARFTIYLPVHKAKADEKAEHVEKRGAVEAVADLWGHGTILLVEDEAAVRTFAYRALSKKGYSVLEAGSGEAALEIVKSHEGTIDLVISDVIMPNMDGPTLVKEIQKLRPDAKIIFISGYAQDGFRNGADTADHHFLPKPFSLSQLAEKVKSVMQEL